MIQDPADLESQLLLLFLSSDLRIRTWIPHLHFVVGPQGCWNLDHKFLDAHGTPRTLHYILSVDLKSPLSNTLISIVGGS